MASYIVANNIYGSSAASAVGNGAVIVTYPDEPQSFAENILGRTASSLSLQWSAGASDGGSVVTNYVLSQAVGAGVFSVIDSAIATTSKTVSGLTFGVTYRFTIHSQNAYGLSQTGPLLTLLCATVPATPAAPSTAVSGNLLVVTFSAPSD